MNRFKIQRNKTESDSASEQWFCFKSVILSYICIFFPLVVGLYTVSTFFDIPYTYDTMAPWYVYSWKMIASLMMEDTWHYIAHRTLHHPKLYWIHKQHHTFKAPFSLTAEYAHPIETLALGVGFFIPCVLLCDHLVYFWLWLAFRALQTAEVHSGYYFWFNPTHLIPFWAGSKFHDFHHEINIGNFASSFVWWDWLFGTDVKFRQHESKRASATKKNL
jgi:methylsterol monooxygenase